MAAKGMSELVLDYFADGTPIVESAEAHPGYSLMVGERSLDVWDTGRQVVYSATISENETMMGFVTTRQFAEELRQWLVSGYEPESWRPAKQEDTDGAVVAAYVMLAGLLFASVVGGFFLLRWLYGG